MAAVRHSDPSSLPPGAVSKAMLIVLGIAILVRLQGLGWDDWRAFHPDERNLVTAAAGLSFGNLVPDFHAYGALSLWLPRLLGAVTDPGCAGAQCLLFPARLISVLFAVISVWLGALICRRLGSDRAMLIGASVLALSAPLIQWAHFGTTESALICLVLALWWQSLRYLDGRDTAMKAMAVSALLIGLGLGMKLAAGAMTVVPLTALLLRWPGLAKAAFLLGLGAVITGVLFAATNPSVVVDTERFLGTMTFEGGIVAGTTDVFWTWQFVDTVAVVFQVQQLASMLGWGIAALAIAGMVWAVARRQLGALPGLAFLIIYGVIVFTWYAKFARYLAPMLPIMVIFAAISLDKLWDWRRSLTLRIVLIGVLGLSILSGLSMAISFQAEDPRIRAARVLSDKVKPGQSVLMEPREVGVHAIPDVTSVFLSHEEISGQAGAATLAQKLADADWMVLYSRRHWSVLPRLLQRFPGACPYYAALASGALGYAVTDRVTRAVPFGPLGTLGVSAEETRVVFDRPKAYILQNVQRLPAATIAERLSATPDPGACGKAALATALDQAR